MNEPAFSGILYTHFIIRHRVVPLHFASAGVAGVNCIFFFTPLGMTVRVRPGSRKRRSPCGEQSPRGALLSAFPKGIQMSKRVFLGLSAIERGIGDTVDVPTLRWYRAHCFRFAEAIRARLGDLRGEILPIENKVQFCEKQAHLASYEGLLEYAEGLLLKIESRVREQGVRGNVGAAELVSGLHPTMAAAIVPFFRSPPIAAANKPYLPDAA